MPSQKAGATSIEMLTNDLEAQRVVPSKLALRLPSAINWLWRFSERRVGDCAVSKVETMENRCTQGHVYTSNTACGISLHCAPVKGNGGTAEGEMAESLTGSKAT